jgi:molybdopterin/thiamine biosynthesis adenylyltransferase
MSGAARPRSVEVVFSAQQFAWLHAHLFQPNGDEQAAFAFATPAEGEGRLRLLVHHLLPMEPSDYVTQNGGYLHMTDEAAQRVARHTLTNEYSLIEIHSHPFAHEHVGFSSIDTTQAAPRFAWFASKAKPPFHHLMLVFGHDSADGMIYNPESAEMEPIDGVTILSHPIKRYALREQADDPEAARYQARFSRQIQAFGAAGQARVRATRVGIVGLGGIGSAVAQQLALLGVRQFVLVDGDTLEDSNLNRFIGGDALDAARQRRKVEVMRDALEAIDPKTMRIDVHASAFPTPASASALKTCDVLFGCTDSHGSRLLLNSFAIQYMLPYIDIGVGLTTDADGKITESGGQYRVVMPDGFCLECVRAINSAMAADDLLPPEQRKLRQERGYIPTEDIHAPSVVFLNGTLASMAVGEFLNLLTGYRAAQRLVYYFLHDHSTRSIAAVRREDCAVCGVGGRLAAGDLEQVLGLTPSVPLTLSDLPTPSAHE